MAAWDDCRVVRGVAALVDGRQAEGGVAALGEDIVGGVGAMGEDRVVGDTAALDDGRLVEGGGTCTVIFNSCANSAALDSRRASESTPLRPRTLKLIINGLLESFIDCHQPLTC